MAYLCSLISNFVIKLYGKKGTAFTKPEDYLIKWGSSGTEEVQKQSVDQIKAALMGIAKSQDKQVKRRKQ